MAEEQVIISVDLEAGDIEKRLNEISNEMARVKFEQQQLNEQTKKGVPVTGEFLKQQAALKREMQELTRQQSNLTAAVSTANKTTKDYGDSLDGMRSQLKDMQASYATLTKAQRESAEGQEFLKAIKAQSDAVKELEAAMGDNRRNVGNYADAILDASGKMGGFGKATSAIINPIKGATNGLKAMAATPIIAILNVLITIIVKLADKFKQNGAAMESLTKTFGLFNGVGVIVNKIIDGIAQGVVWLADKLYELADRFGLISDVAKESARLSKEQLDIQKAENALIAETADRELKISELRAKVAEKNKYTAQQRLEFLKEAQRLEKEQSDAEYQLAKRRYELQVALNAQSESSQDDLRKENELYAAMVGAQTAYNNKVRELNAQMTEAQNAMRSEIAKTTTSTEKAAADEVKAEEEKVKKIRSIREQYGLVTDDEKHKEQLEILKKYYDDQLLTEEEYLQAQANLRKDSEEKAAQSIRSIREQYGLVTDDEKYKEQLEILKKYYDDQLFTVEEYLQAQANLRKEYGLVTDEGIDELAREMFGVDKEAIEYYNSLLESGMDKLQAFRELQSYVAKENVKNFATAAGAMSKAFNDMAGALEKYGKENENAQKAQKAFALAGILASQAQSISEGALAISAGIASAQSVPFPANIAAIATTVATITGLLVSTASSFAQAKQLLSGADAGAFEQGGVVGGTSYTGDKLTARVNSNEVILNPKQVSNVLYQMANSPIGGGIDYEAMAAAVSALPAPVMDYTEFKQFGQKVSTYNEIARI